MTIYLKQSTASQEVTLGHFLDSTDGNTEETALTIANTDIKLHKAGATTLVNKNSGGATHISNGIYYIVLDATDTNTLGSLVIYCHVSGALAVKVECTVLAANVYDSLIGGGDTLDVQVTGIGSGAITATSIASNAITSAKIATDAIGAAQIAANAIGASELATDAVTEIQSGLATAAELAKVPKSDSTVTWNATALASINAQCDTALADYDAPTNTEMTAAFTEIKGATWATTDTLEAIRDRGDAAWTTADVSGLATSSALATVGLNVDAVLVDTGTTIPAQISALNNLSSADVNAACDTALADYDPPTNTEMVAAFTEIKGATWATTDTLENIRDEQVALDTVADAVKAKTDQLVFTKANELDINVQSINGVAITGDGSGTPFGV